MAQLFQPTNIIPNLNGEFGNGYVIPEDIQGNLLYVYWQVNGNTAMTGWKIDFYSRDGSTLLYTTGLSTAKTPFYGCDESGNPVLFVGYVSWTDLSAYVEAGGEYRMFITAYWGSSQQYSVTNQSPAVFQVRNAPTVTLAPSSVEVSGTDYAAHTYSQDEPYSYDVYDMDFTFAVSYAQSEGDGVMWSRWRLTELDSATGDEIELADTGKVFGSVELAFDYAHYFPGRLYTISFEAMTETGYSISESTSFMVSYTCNEVTTLTLQAYNAPYRGSAVSLELNDSVYNVYLLLGGLSLYRDESATARDPMHVDNSFGSTARIKMYDYSATNNTGACTYYLYIKTKGTSYASLGDYIYVKSNEVTPCSWAWAVLVCGRVTKRYGSDGIYVLYKDRYLVEACYLFANNVSSGSVSNNNRPKISSSFGKYPSVGIAPQNYKSGTLQSMIGSIDYGLYEETPNVYSDSIELRDAIYALATTEKALFLKNRKGDLLRIRVSGEITMETMDNTKEQAQTVSFPWVESGSADGIALYAYNVTEAGFAHLDV